MDVNLWHLHNVGYKTVHLVCFSWVTLVSGLVLTGSVAFWGAPLTDSSSLYSSSCLWDCKYEMHLLTRPSWEYRLLIWIGLCCLIIIFSTVIWFLFKVITEFVLFFHSLLRSQKGEEEFLRESCVLSAMGKNLRLIINNKHYKNGKSYICEGYNMN